MADRKVQPSTVVGLRMKGVNEDDEYKSIR